MKKPALRIAHTYVRKLFNYDPDIGMLTWRISQRRTNVGDEAGTIGHNGRYVNIDYQRYSVNIIIWFWVHNYWPKGPPSEVIDHINRNPFDNRINNLRLVTTSENNRNRRRQANNQTGVPGVSFHNRDCKYYTYITVNKKPIFLGEFLSLETAAEVRRAAEIQYFGEFAPKD